MYEINEINIRSREHRRTGLSSTILVTSLGILVVRDDIAPNEPIQLGVATTNETAKTVHRKNSFTFTGKTEPNEVFATSTEVWQSTFGSVHMALQGRGAMNLSSELMALTAS